MVLSLLQQAAISAGCGQTFLRASFFSQSDLWRGNTQPVNRPRRDLAIVRSGRHNLIRSSSRVLARHELSLFIYYLIRLRDPCTNLILE